MFERTILQQLEAVQRSLDDVVRPLDVDQITVDDADALLAVVDRIAKQAEGAAAVLAARATESAGSRRAGWKAVAASCGLSEQEARERVTTGQAVRSQEATRAALQHGLLAPATAKAIALAAAADPTCEGRLLAATRSASAQDVRRDARRIRQQASGESEQQRHERRHRDRRLSTWEDDDGGISGRLSTTTAQWAFIDATLALYQEAAFRRARRTGEHASQPAYRMDALALMAHVAAGGDPATMGYERGDLPAALRHLVDDVELPDSDAPPDVAGTPAAPTQADPVPVDDLGPLPDPDRYPPGHPKRAAAQFLRDERLRQLRDRAETGPPGDPPAAAPHARRRPPQRSAVRGGGGVKAKVIVRIDLEALKRGSAAPGETCDIAGVGPVPVSTARDLLGDAFLSLLVTRGRDVCTVAHAGRAPNAWQRTALEWSLDECSTQGCHDKARREAHHDEPWTESLHTWLPTLRGPCPHCHDSISHHGWAYLDEPDTYGKYPLVAPDDTRHPSRRGEREARPRPAVVTPKRTRPQGRTTDPELPLTA